MEYETYADVIDAYNADNMGYSTLTDYIKGQNIKIKEIEMDPIGDMQKIFENKADGGMIGIEVLFKEKMKDGGRAGFFMGGPALEGQALQIYNSMKNYNFTDQEIADALSARGLYTPAGSESTTQPNIIGSQLNQSAGGGGGTGIMELQETFTRAPGSTPKFSEDAFFGLGRFLQGKERGTLGNRLQKQFELGQKLPLPLAKIAGAQSPFNPDSKNYNPDFIDQLNFLELGDDMIGMSGTGLKYGSGSVLRGQNVISGFGSNNYLAQLNKYINRKNITDRARKRAEDERAAFLAAEEKRKAAEAQRQRDIQEAATRRTYSLSDLQDSSDRGTGQSYAAARERTASRVGPGGNVKAYGLKDGGLATMFTRRR